MNCSRCGLAIRDGESHPDADACIAAWGGFWQATQDVLRMFCETNEELKAQNATQAERIKAMEEENAALRADKERIVEAVRRFEGQVYEAVERYALKVRK